VSDAPSLPSFFDETTDRTIVADVRALPRGYRIDEFEILEVIGSGGFAIVYRALDHSLGQERAIKEYLPRALAGRFSSQLVTVLSKEDEATYQEGLRRFVAEARLLAGINHPAVVRVHRCIEANRTAYMVMDLCAGESLEQRLARGAAFDEAGIRRFLTLLLGGVEVLHARHILHRDIKPSNIFVADDGSPTMIDFGSAREVAGSNQAMTAIVTYNYSAPEQWDSTGQFTQGPYSDLYSIGATCYQIVTGRKPNTSNTRLLRDTLVPAAEAAAGRYGPALLASIDKALAVDVKARYQAAAEWLRDLQAPARTGASSRNGGPAVAAIAMLVALGAGAWWLLHHHDAGVQQAAVAAGAAAVPAGPAPGTLLRDCPTCPELVAVAAGTFQQGAAGNDADKDEMPRHAVAIAHGLAVGRFEVTVSQFREFVNASGYAFGGDASCGRKHAGVERSWKDPGFAQRDDEPVVCVSWFDATAYAQWLSKATGRHYRLPSESEWEYLARAGSERAVPWDDAAGACNDANLLDESYVQRVGTKAVVKCDDQSPFTAAGSPELRRNAFGVHDALGNAAEWVQDCKTADYSNAPTDGSAVDSPTCQQRVFRGGAFNYPVSEVRFTRREALPPGERKPFIGLRVVRDLESAGASASPGAAAASPAAAARSPGASAPASAVTPAAAKAAAKPSGKASHGR
jgi:formylglycine-generating enzyme required for sulfatase activity